MIKSFWSQFAVSALLIAVLFSFSLNSVFSQNYAAEAVTADIGTQELHLIIDPGHGGEDGGAVSVTGTYESSINLSIALRAEQLAAFMGTAPIMTRTSENIEYPEDATTTRARKISDQKSRVALINSTENAVLISIHQNKYTSAGPSGAQVFYSNDGQALAEELQNLFLSYINKDNKRTASKISDSIYLMNAISCPAVLVECGFISNPKEAELLETDEYQKKLSLIIMGGFFGFYER